jgi:hypothetical protein
MTEEQWLACTDPRPMLEFLRGRASERKLRLFACAVCRDRFIWPLWLTDERSRRAVEVAERYVDGRAAARELNAARAAAWAPVRSANDARLQLLARTAWGTARDGARAADTAVRAFQPGPTVFLSGLLREIFGNPFRPSPPLSASVLAWNGGTVGRLAESVYDERDFGRLPILADALEEAGCADADLLSHCRYEGPPPVAIGPEFREPADVRTYRRREVPHVRGCWALDHILGRE